MYNFLHQLRSYRAKKTLAVFKSSQFLALPILLSGLIVIMTSASAMAGTGTLDPAFGSGGQLNVSKPLSAIAHQPDGKIIVGVADLTNYTLDSKFILIRYNPDGSVDNSFGNGEVQTDFDGGINNITSIFVRPDGKIVVVGRRNYNFTNYIIVARYNANGSLDNTFDGDGRATVSGYVLTSQYVAAVQSDEKIVIAASHEMIRINADGSLDNSYGFNGRINFAFDDVITSITVQTDNKILVAGYIVNNDNNITVLRFNTNGAPDNSFAVAGRASTDLGSFNDRSYSIALQDDGKILVAGYKNFDGSANFALVRYNTNGTLDNDFGAFGLITPGFGPRVDPIITIQPDGKILASGGGNNFEVGRFNANGATDNTFNSTGFSSIPGLLSSQTVGALITGSDLLIVATHFTPDKASIIVAISLGGVSAVPGPNAGLNYRYYTGDFNELPDFDVLKPLTVGISPNIDIAVRPASTADHFAFVWEGFIKIETPGTYTFETVSDDGSKFYFNSFYSSEVKALVNNNGIHTTTSATGSVNITAAGFYPIAITYFEKDGGESMQLYYSGPNLARQPVPNALLTTRYDAVDNTAPSAPANVHPVYKGRRFVRLDWENSIDNVGVKEYRVYNYGSLVLTTTQSFADIMNLQVGQPFLFSVRAVDFAGNVSDLSNQFSFSLRSQLLNYKLFENVPYGVASLQGLTALETGAMNNVDLSKRPSRINSNYAYVWEGFITIPTAGNYTFTTLSDDGSRFYFDSFYANDIEPLVDNYDNNGLHAPQTISKTVNIPAPGLYPIALLYHQYLGDQVMKLYWQGPGFAQQLVPDDAFTSDIIPPSVTTGLSYKYYEGNWTTLPDFTTLTPVKEGVSPTIDLNVRPAGRNNNFAFVWEGYIDVEIPGVYTFETFSDDGSKLYFNSKYVPTALATVNNDGIHDGRSAKGTVNIAAKGRYPISITYFESTGDQQMEVYWTGPSVPRQRIAAEVFSPYPSQVIRRLNYSLSSGTWTVLPDFDMMGAVQLGSSNNIDISKRPADLNDGFAFRWQGYISIPAPGIYTFETISDDGSKLYFTGGNSFASDVLVNNDGVHPAKSASGSIVVSNAGVYPFQATFFELNSAQVMEVYWSGPGIPRQRIPDEAFPMLMTPQATYPFTFSPIPSIYSTAPISAATTNPEAAPLHGAYPNPFDESITIDFYNSLSTNDISIGLYDLNGRKVLMQHAGKLPAGNNLVKVNLNGVAIKEGVYIVQIQKNGIAWKTMKVVKLKK